MLLRLSLVIGLLFGGVGFAEEPGRGLLPPLSGFGERGVPGRALIPTAQILFHKPERAKVYWDVSKEGELESPGLSLPGRQNFPANALYRLRLVDLPDGKGDEFFPTLEIAPLNPRREKYLAVNAIPVQFTGEDFDFARRGEAVTKVVYLPDEEFAELAPPGGVDTLISFLLDDGVDPVIEADRRGTILAVVRLRDVKLAVRPAEKVAAVSMPEPATTKTPVDSPIRGFRNRRGWFRR